MAGHFHFWPGRKAGAVIGKDKGRTLDPHIGLAIHRFFHPDAELLADIGRVIRAQQTGQTMFCPEFCLFRRAILGNADHPATGGGKCVKKAGKGDGFFGATRRVDTRKEK